MKTQDTTKDNCNQRVVVIGLDGATFDVINPMISAGRLPNISRLIANGSSGKLLSTIPPLSPVAWTSLSTGMNPGKHGILDFLKRIPDSYEVSFFSAASRKAHPLWYWLSSAEKRVGIINVPMTYPPDKVNGFMISGMDSPKEECDFMYPDSLFQELKSEVGGFRLENIDFRSMGNNAEKLIHELYQILENRFDTANYLMDRYPWDFFFLVFEATDRVQHNFWKCINDDAKKAGEYMDLIYNVYEKVDEKIGLLLKKTGPGDTVFVVSDHGFTSIQKGVRLNSWLESQSHLIYRKRMFATKKIQIRVGSLVKNSLKKAIPKKILKLIKKGHGYGAKSHSFNVLPNVDMSKTRAFCLSSYGIYLNLKGRNPLGIVEPGMEYENLREEIMSDLLKIKDPATGKKVIEKVFKREDVIVGKFENIAPDIYILWNEGYFFMGERQRNIMNIKSNDKEIFSDHNWSGQHAQEGILIINGPYIKKNRVINEVNIIDVAPTIMYLMGLDVPEELDGKVLSEAVKEDYLTRNPVKYSRSMDDEPSPEELKESYSDDDAEAIRNRLQNLGYMD